LPSIGIEFKGNHWIEEKKENCFGTFTVTDNGKMWVEGYNLRSEITAKRYFMICGSCFWCASYFIADDDNNVTITSKCPMCDKRKVESMPIADDELYKFDYDLKHGVTLEFSKVNVARGN
jgi:hypothetical protein